MSPLRFSAYRGENADVVDSFLLAFLGEAGEERVFLGGEGCREQDLTRSPPALIMAVAPQRYWKSPPCT